LKKEQPKMVPKTPAFKVCSAMQIVEMTASNKLQDGNCSNNHSSLSTLVSASSQLVSSFAHHLHLCMGFLMARSLRKPFSLSLFLWSQSSLVEMLLNVLP
jgi:4-hydroxy-3-methylbut-2-en-1-yl diphosphate synthase IspG/GcpE